MKHQDQKIQKTLTELNDMLCSWERDTGRQSVLVLREQGGFEHRSMSGKPIESDAGLTDAMMFDAILD
ncbi:MAG: hypothetical protein HOP06_10165 [Methylotenera sp.]|nr:hypothetical protein [Methylotenera sp.]